MAAKRDLARLKDELLAMLSPAFDGIDVRLHFSKRWNRNCVTLRWSGFEGLLPEERFHRLVSVIPEEFRKSHLAGFVWLELTPTESVEVHLKSPRSEDVAARKAEIYHALHQASVFDSLRTALGTNPQKKCPGDLSTLARLLGAGQFAQEQITNAKLLFIGEGVFCDCQALSAQSRIMSQSDAGVA